MMKTYFCLKLFLTFLSLQLITYKNNTDKWNDWINWKRIFKFNKLQLIEILSNVNKTNYYTWRYGQQLSSRYPSSVWSPSSAFIKSLNVNCFDDITNKERKIVNSTSLNYLRLYTLKNARKIFFCKRWWTLASLGLWYNMLQIL